MELDDIIPSAVLALPQPWARTADAAPAQAAAAVMQCGLAAKQVAATAHAVALPPIHQFQFPFMCRRVYYLS